MSDFEKEVEDAFARLDASSQKIRDCNCLEDILPVMEAYSSLMEEVRSIIFKALNQFEQGNKLQTDLARDYIKRLMLSYERFQEMCDVTVRIIDFEFSDPGKLPKA